MPRKPTDRRLRMPALHTQVLIGIIAGIAVGYVAPHAGASLKVLGDLFIKSIKMIIGLVIFCTVVNGISGMGDMKKVGRVGGKALLYFECMSTLALLFGAVVGDLLHPGAGFDVNPARLDSAAVASYAGAAHAQSAVKFLADIIPSTVTGAFAEGQILPVVFVSLLFGYALSHLGERGQPLRAFVDSLTHVIFGIINLLMRTAPIGAFGAMAYTVGRFGLTSLGPLFDLMVVFAVMCVVFIVVVMGAVCRWAGINIFAFLRYLQEELLVTLGASSSDVAMPALMEKLQQLGCSQSVVGLVVPTGYVFNADGTSLYMVLAALFIAQAMNIHLTVMQQLALFGVSMLTSKGASGISGAGFIALVGTLSVVPAIPAAGMALLLGIDRIMSTMRAIVNITGNAVATVLMASFEGELDRGRLAQALSAGRPAGRSEEVMQSKSTLRVVLFIVTVLLATGVAAPRATAASPPLRLIRTVPMPGVQGDFDHFIVDLPHDRLFVTTEDHRTLEVFELHTGALLGAITGFGSPHSGVFLPARNRLLVTDSDAGAVRVLDATSHRMLRTIAAVPQADAMTYDPSEHLMYVTGGGDDAHLDYSLIGVIDTRREVKVGEVRIPSANIESLALGPGGRLLYVNIRDRHAIGVVDRHTLKLVGTWTLRTIHQNTPLIYDERDQRLFVGGRGPGVFAVLDAHDGHVIASLPAPDGVDDLSWDPESGRIYFPCMDGHLAVFRQLDADHYESLGTVPTGYRGKTGVLVPQLDRYFVAVSTHGGSPARLFVFQVLHSRS